MLHGQCPRYEIKYYFADLYTPRSPEYNINMNSGTLALCSKTLGKVIDIYLSQSSG